MGQELLLQCTSRYPTNFNPSSLRPSFDVNDATHTFSIIPSNPDQPLSEDALTIILDIVMQVREKFSASSADCFFNVDSIF